MKKLLMIAIIFSLSLAAFGQREQQKEKPTPEQRAERMTDRMAEQLELTEVQKQEIYAINLQNAQKRQAEMEARRIEMEARREAMKSQMESQRAQIDAVLTPEQKEKWEEIRAENRRKIDERSRNGRGGSRGEKTRQERHSSERHR
ncbi:DUF4890 domain-containing protein [Shivajiella indica]|uniref:DUF4890 domain-containing protein n=1 Tax=Shivajiella indica TaxID=872115 RepID=A0ABW5B9R1_9BACT